METTEIQSSATFSSWCIVSLFGHQKIIGHVTETKLAGGAFLKVDAPSDDGQGVKFTAFFSPGSIYSIQPISKEIALELAKNTNQTPVTEWDVPKLANELKQKFTADAKIALPSSQHSVEGYENEVDF